MNLKNLKYSAICLLVYLFNTLTVTAINTNFSEFQPLDAAAQVQDFQFEGIQYRVLSEENAYVEVIAKSPKYIGSINIPTAVNHDGKTYAVKAIADYAFSFCDSLTQVNIAEGLTAIGYGAFSYCYGLEGISLPESITTIQDFAFGDSGLKHITIPNTVSELGDSSFSGCENLASAVLGTSITVINDMLFYDCPNLKTVEIPSSVISIGAYAFAVGGLTRIYIPNSVISIGDEAFASCHDLSFIHVDSSNPPSLGNDVFNVIGTQCILVPNGSKNQYLADENWRLFAAIIEVDAVLAGDFGSDLSYVFDAATLTLNINGNGSMGDFYFLEDNPWSNYISIIDSVYIQDGVKNIAAMAFDGATNLRSINLPNTITQIGYYAFSRTGLKNLMIPNSVTAIQDYAFSENLFLESIQLSEQINTIPAGAFYNCKQLLNCDIPASVTHINEHAFNACGLQTLQIPNHTKAIGGYAFAYCDSLSQINLGNELETIGDGAFYFCKNIKNINIPASTDSIGKYVFHYWNQLENIEVHPNNEYFVSIDGILYNKNQSTIMLCPEQKSGTYNFPESITHIAPGAFSNCNKLSFQDFPSGLKLIDDYAFESCKTLIKLNIPEGTDSIGTAAFANCTKLQEVKIPLSIQQIKDYAFAGCGALEMIEVAWENPIEIELNVFEDIDIQAITLHIPTNSLNNYINAKVWKNFNLLELIESNLKQVTNPVLTIFPNPFTDYIQVNGNETITKIIITDISGSEKLTIAPVQSNEKIRLQNLPVGIYCMEITTEAGRYQKKIIKR